MGLIALIFSVVVDAIWPLRGRPQDLPLNRQAGDPPIAGVAADPDAADLLADPPYDPLVDPLVDPAVDPLVEAGVDVPRAPAAEVRHAVHPLLRHALRLVDWVAVDEPAMASRASVVRSKPRQVSAPGWLAIVGIPTALVAVAEALLGSIAGFLVFALHVAVLYLTVGLGAFHRQFSELQLLVGAGEEASARVVLARWIGAGSAPAVDLRQSTPFERGDAGSTALASAAASQSVLAAYRDVFAPLFWYVVLPGAVGPVLYLFARFAACHSYSFARAAYCWIDWIPMRLVSLVFALVGRFEDTMYCLRVVSPLRVPVEADPYLHQRLVLLPVAGGALGLRLADAGVDHHLRTHAPDLDLPGVEPDPASLRSISGLLLRSAVVATGAWLLGVLLG
jgi:membrane protein required for beta-lactamase induction